jgi:hypothetical protein
MITPPGDRSRIDRSPRGDRRPAGYDFGYLSPSRGPGGFSPSRGPGLRPSPSGGPRRFPSPSRGGGGGIVWHLQVQPSTAGGGGGGGGRRRASLFSPPSGGGGGGGGGFGCGQAQQGFSSPRGLSPSFRSPRGLSPSAFRFPPSSCAPIGAARNAAATAARIHPFLIRRPPRECSSHPAQRGPRGGIVPIRVSCTSNSRDLD